MTEGFSWLALVRVCCLLLALVPPAHAQEISHDAARTYFDRGLALVDDEKFEEAAVQFEHAYALKPHASVLYNVAKAHAAARNCALAARAFERYLETAGDISPERRREVLSALARTSACLATLDIVTTPEHAEVRLDGRPIRPGEQQLDPGRHLVAISAVGHAPLEQEVSLSAGQKLRLALSLEALAPATELVVSAPPVALAPVAALGAVTHLPEPPQLMRREKREVAPPPDNRRALAAATTAGVGLLLAGVTVGLVVDNAARYKRWQVEQDELDLAWREQSAGAREGQAQNDSRANRIKLQDQIATGVGVASAACVVASLVIWFVRDEPPKDLRAAARVTAGSSRFDLALSF